MSLGCGHFCADELGQCGKPLFFILEFWAVQGFAVDAIDVDDAHAVDGGGDDAALRVVGEGGEAAMYVLRFVAADDGDAVVGFFGRSRRSASPSFVGRQLGICLGRV